MIFLEDLANTIFILPNEQGVQYKHIVFSWPIRSHMTTYDSHICHPTRTKRSTCADSIHALMQSLVKCNQLVSKSINMWHVNHRRRTVDDIRQVIGNSLHKHITMTKGDEMFAYNKKYSCNITIETYGKYFCFSLFCSMMIERHTLTWE